jgi:hypothetical protein
MSKDTLRKKILDLKPAAGKPVVVDGETYEVRPPTVAKRGRILKASGFAGGADKGDVAKLELQAVLELVVDPATGEPVFTEADRPVLQGLPVGGWFDQLASEAAKALNVKGLTLDEQLQQLQEGQSDEVQAVLEEARARIAVLKAADSGNSSTTPSNSSSTS